MFVAGGVAGATARTASAPLDRVKLLFQVQAVAARQGRAASGVASASEYTGVAQSLRKIYAEEGLAAFWKGNFTNVVRIFPYSACQLMANDIYKRALSSGDGKPLTVTTRLTAGKALPLRLASPLSPTRPAHSRACAPKRRASLPSLLTPDVPFLARFSRGSPPMRRNDAAAPILTLKRSLVSAR